MNKTAEKLNNEGVQFFINGKFEEAHEKYKLGLGKSPKNATILNNLGMLSLQQKEYKNAVNYFEEANNINETTTYKLNLGHAKANLNLLDEAELHYKESLKISVNNLKAWKSLGSLYQFQKKHENAINVWETILNNYSNKEIYKIELAKDYMAVNKNDMAYDLLLSLTNSTKLIDQVWYLITIIHFKNKNLGLAKKTIFKSLAMNPSSELFRSSLAKIHFALYEYEEAISQWEFILKINVENTIARIEKSKILLIIEKINEALIELEFILKFDKNNAEANYFKAIGLIKKQSKKSEILKILNPLIARKNKYTVLAKELLTQL